MADAPPAPRPKTPPPKFENLFPKPSAKASDTALPTPSMDSRRPRILIAAIVTLVAVPLVASIALWPDRDQAGSAGAPVVAQTQPDTLTPSKAVLRAFLDAREPAEVYPLIRFPTRYTEEVRGFFADRSTPPTYLPPVPLSTAAIPVGAEAGFFTQRDGTFPHLVYTTKIDNGDLRIDWGAFTAYNPTRIDSLTEIASDSETPTKAPFRVIASPSSYYNFAFEDADIWLAFELRVPAEDRTVHGYARRDSQLADALTAMVSFSGNPARITLLLEASPASGSSSQYRIRAISADSWLLPGADQPALAARPAPPLR